MGKYLKLLRQGPITNYEEKKGFSIFLTIRFFFFLAEPMLSPNFNVSLASLVKYERYAEN